MEPQTTPPKCPSCARGLLSRIAKLCSWCGAHIPDSIRYTPAELAVILAEEAEAQAARDAAEKERENQAIKDALTKAACEIAGVEILKAYKKHTE